jgi:hypothetical protein
MIESDKLEEQPMPRLFNDDQATPSRRTLEPRSKRKPNGSGNHDAAQQPCLETKTNDVKRFCCNNCEFTSSRKYNLERHQMLHFESNVPSLKCDFVFINSSRCNYTTRNKHLLKRHQQSHKKHIHVDSELGQAMTLLHDIT